MPKAPIQYFLLLLDRMFAQFVGKFTAYDRPCWDIRAQRAGQRERGMEGRQWRIDGIELVTAEAENNSSER